MSFTDPRRLYTVFCLIMSAVAGSSIAMGVVIFTIFKDFQDVVGKPYLIPPAVFITSGVFGLTTTMLSFASRQSKNKNWNKAAITIQITGFILALVAIVVGFTMRKTLIDSLTKSLTENSPTKHPKVWDKIQHTFECCGHSNITEWENHRTCPPHSCCPKGSCQSKAVYRGCGHKLSNYFDSDYYITLGLVGTSVPIYMIFIAMQLFLPADKPKSKLNVKT